MRNVRQRTGNHKRTGGYPGAARNPDRVGRTRTAKAAVPNRRRKHDLTESEAEDMNKISAEALSKAGDKYLGRKYTEMDCQKFAETCMADVGLVMDS